MRNTVLAVTQNPEHRDSLAAMLAGDNWKIKNVRSWSEARNFLSRHCPSVITCDNDLPDGSWRNLLHGLHGIENPPPVIVTSRHADESLWAEVLNLGGYDLLQTPVEEAEVRRVISMARRHGERQSREAQLSLVPAAAEA